MFNCNAIIIQLNNKTKYINFKKGVRNLELRKEEKENKKTKADKANLTNTETKYSLSELEQAANTFGVKPECVRAAFFGGRKYKSYTKRGTEYY